MALSNNQKMAIGAAGVTIAAVTAILITGKAAAKTPPPSGQVPTTLTLMAAQPAVDTGIPDSFTATLYDQSGTPIPSYSITLSDQTTGTSSASSTDGSGKAVFSVTFTSSGTYNFVASA